MIKTIFISRLMKIYLIFILFGLNACDFNPISSEFRNKISESNQGNIVIGVVGSSDTQNLFVEGVKTFHVLPFRHPLIMRIQELC
jgi:hypothetical protein